MIMCVTFGKYITGLRDCDKNHQAVGRHGGIRTMHMHLATDLHSALLRNYASCVVVTGNYSRLCDIFCDISTLFSQCDILV